MSNSSLVNVTILSPNNSGPRNHKIDTITIHHMAGNLSVETCGNMFARSSTGASSNYGIGSDGRIGLYVEESNRSWATASSSNDNRAVTIEVANSGGAPDWPISSAAYNSLIILVADICKRNGIKKLLWKADPNLVGQVDKQNMTVHRWFVATACPGNYVYNLHSQIASDVNKLLGSSSESSESKEECDVNLPLLKKGDEGHSVIALQTLLIGYGYNCGGFGADGIFGDGTDVSVKSFQKHIGVVQDGLVGPKTWKGLLL